RGRGWHQDKWADPPSPAVEGFPIHDALSAAVPDHPVLLTHASGHAAIANAAALRAANVDVDAVAAAARTPDPPGGEIVRRDDGRPTGLLRELAAGLVDAARQRDEGPTDRETLRRYVALATDEVQRNGITSFHDAGTGFGAIELLKEAARDGTLGVRLWIMARADHDTLAASLPVAKVRDLADGMLTVGGIKLQIDGALGARGAWLLEPYTDAPGHFGLALMTVEEAERVAELAVENDVQLAIHAIGDRANREVLDLYERVQQRHPGVRDKRWRVEHAQHLHPDDVPRFAALGAVASMQGVHCTSDGPWVPNRLGLVRSEQGAYLWRTLVESGALLINGTDAPVEDVDPLASYISTVTRRMANGRAFFPAQALDRHTALASYTRNAAEAVFELADKGTLEVGKRADIVVLSGDPLTVDDDALDDLRVEMTILNGQTVYRAESSHAAPAAG
ncbi:MAG: amidohydrolase, partial [Acidobacteriota bacterium]